jgi:hypothetical protein
MQKGYIYQTNGAWHVRYRVDGKQVSRKLADYNDQYRTKRSVRPLARLRPFHEDHSPSLVISPQKNLWNCLGGAGGKDQPTNGYSSTGCC